MAFVHSGWENPVDIISLRKGDILSLKPGGTLQCYGMSVI